MGISNFTSLLELAAGLNVALVAVETYKSYTHVLARKVFNLPSFVDICLHQSYVKLENRTSLEEIDKLDMNGVDGMLKVEECKRDSEILRSLLEDTKKTILNKIDKYCELKSFSGLSLWAFLYCVILLIFSGFSDTVLMSILMEYVFVIISLLTFIYFIIGWIFGERSQRFSSFYKSLSFVIILFMIVLFIICILILVLLLNNITLDFVLSYTRFYTPIFVLLPLFNFIVFFYLIRKKTIAIQIEIREETNDVINQCEKWEKTASDLITSYRTASSLQSAGPTIEREIFLK